jgi:putative endonuclease
VDAGKQRRIRRVADHYLARHDTAGLRVRFDVVSIVLPDGEEPQIEHIPGAF